MRTSHILAAVLVVAAVGAAVASQVPQGFRTGEFGEIANGSATAMPGVIAMDHRMASTGGPDVFVGGVWGRAFDGGTVFEGEKVALTFNTFPKPCNLKIWVAIKAANNGNRLQQKTVRNNGMGRVMLTANFNGQLVYTVQQRNPDISCAVATDLMITPPAAG